MLEGRSPTLEALLGRIHRSFTGFERLRIAMEMSLAACEMSLAAPSPTTPEWSHTERRRELERYSLAPGTLPSVLR